MAESLLFSVAETFIGKLTSRLLEEASLALGVYDDLRRIKDTSSLIKAVLLDAEQKQWQNNELREWLRSVRISRNRNTCNRNRIHDHNRNLKPWLRQIKHVFSDAEDVIDDFECEALRMQVVNTSGSIRRKVRHYFSSSNPLAYRLKMAHQIKDINARLTKVAADRHNFGLQTNYSDTRIVQKRELTHSHIIESDVIGREHDKQIIIDLLLQDGDDKSLTVIPIVGMGGMGKTTLAKSVFNDERLGEAFQKKMWVCVSHDFELKHLLVKILNSASDSSPSENIQNFDIEQLQNHLRNTLVDQKFLLVLDDVWNENRVKWEELKDLIQDSLSVFVKWAFKEGEDKKHPELMEVGENIVQKCGGLPLAIRTLGSSLFLKFDIKEWKFVKDSDIWNLPQKDDGILPAIKLSYDQLPSYLKRCFACFSLFEKSSLLNDFEVTAFWDALGFLPTPKQGENSGDIGKQLLHELWSRSFVQNFVDGGSIFSFGLHDLVHDLALYVARDDFQLLNFQYENIRENVRHLSVLQNDLLSQISIPTGLRTILFPDGANSTPFLNNCLSRCKYLRLLKINNSRYKNLPRSIGKLKHLRCLGLVSNQELERLPDSVCKLQNLQTLDLTDCQKVQKLPNGIGNLIKLQELCITTKQFNFPVELVKLSSLEILEFNNCDNLMFSFEGIQFPKLKLLSFSYCGNLKSLPFHIIPNIETLIIIDCNMVILSMGDDNNNQIPKLKLKLIRLASLPQIVTFPQWFQGCANTLRSLIIENCENLEELPNWFSTFISLKNLLIENCPKLISLPEDVLPNLEHLIMSGCPELYRRYDMLPLDKIGTRYHISNMLPLN
ncbi:unnamed protein product [Trifolium pratense]|uniref:Uncharacterized protein n=1 Tax=Trifolium pratense TaxID=57577 RepID=A0ACB0LVG1_TRIPR|nr:unnamed protein product [Trifolium pratense]